MLLIILILLNNEYDFLYTREYKKAYIRRKYRTRQIKATETNILVLYLKNTYL